MIKKLSIKMSYLKISSNFLKTVKIYSYKPANLRVYSFKNIPAKNSTSQKSRLALNSRQYKMLQQHPLSISLPFQLHFLCPEKPSINFRVLSSIT